MFQKAKSKDEPSTVEIKIKVDCSDLYAAQEKATRLVETLQQAEQIIASFNQKEEYSEVFRKECNAPIKI